MKKIFTLIAAAFIAVSVNAQTSVLLYSNGEKGHNVLSDEYLEGNPGGWTLQCMNTAKNLDPGGKITVDGTEYKGIKASNGAQNKLTLPKGYVATKVTLYSYINKSVDDAKTSYWKEVNGTTYSLDGADVVNKNEEGEVVSTTPTVQIEQMQSYQDGTNPDVKSFTFEGGVQTVTFTNTGTQPVFILSVEYKEGTPSGISSVEANVAENNVAYNLAGQKVSDSYKGVVIINGKKVIK